MLAKVSAPAHIGLSGRLIEVECDITAGLPALVVVGLPDKAVEEAKERVRGAIRNAGLVFPPKRITLNLAPADLPKDGTAYDLALAIAVLAASEQLILDSPALFAGELALNGSLRPIKGAISYAKLALNNQITTLYIPTDNAPEAALIRGITVIPVDNLRDLYRHIIGEKIIAPFKSKPLKHKQHVATTTTNLAEVYGQDSAKRALEVAAAGGHNLLLTGPPGSGKTLLAKALVGILPTLSFDESLETTEIHSLAGVIRRDLVVTRPFRAPHHTASDVALIGGGRVARPGEISLSHNGVLFLDELPEFTRSVLEVLRQPLEDREVTVARASGAVTYPASFMLVATQNPCPCGYAGDPAGACTCLPSQVQRYARKVSGPLLDRIDVQIQVGRVEHDKLVAATASESSNVVAKRVQAARRIQADRFKGSVTKTNAEMTNADIKRYCAISAADQAFIKRAAAALGLSGRSYMRLLKVARTIADLSDRDTINQSDIAEALQYRQRQG